MDERMETGGMRIVGWMDERRGTGMSIGGWMDERKEGECNEDSGNGMTGESSRDQERRQNEKDQMRMGMGMGFGVGGERRAGRCVVCEEVTES